MGEGESIYLLCEPQSPLPQTAENNMYLAGLRGLGDPAGHRAQHTDPQWPPAEQNHRLSQSLSKFHLAIESVLF